MGLRPVIELTSMGAGKDEVPESGDLLESQRDGERKDKKKTCQDIQVPPPWFPAPLPTMGLLLFLLLRYLTSL